MSTPKPEDEREALARIIDPRAWEPPLIPETYRSGQRDESLRVADLVLAAGFSRVVLVSDEAVEAAWATLTELADDIRYFDKTEVRTALEAAYREER